MIEQTPRVVRVDGSDQPYEVTFRDADVLGARCVIRRLRLPDDDRDACYGYVSWSGSHLIVVVQDPERFAHAVEERLFRWPYSSYDFTPLDDPANAQHAAETVVEIARGRIGF